MTTQLKNDRQARSQLRSSVRSGLMSDLFGGESNVWMGSAASGAGVLGSLRADIADARRFRHQTLQLRNRGVHGAALNELLATGDTEDLASILALGKSGARTYQRLYGQRARAVRAAETRAGNLVYTRDPHLSKQIQALRGDVHRLEKAMHNNAKNVGKHVGKELNGVAGHAGHRHKGRG